MDSLVAFLYVLMRDEVVPGKVEAIMKSHVELLRENGQPVVFSNKYLEAYARSLAERIVEPCK